jgi:hypothetical protein
MLLDCPILLTFSIRESRIVSVHFTNHLDVYIVCLVSSWRYRSRTWLLDLELI